MITIKIQAKRFKPLAAVFRILFGTPAQTDFPDAAAILAQFYIENFAIQPTWPEHDQSKQDSVTQFEHEQDNEELRTELRELATAQTEMSRQIAHLSSMMETLVKNSVANECKVATQTETDRQIAQLSSTVGLLVKNSAYGHTAEQAPEKNAARSTPAIIMTIMINR